MVLKSKTRASYLINLQLSPIEDLPAAQNNIGREAQLGSSRVEAELIEFLMMFNIIQPRNGVWQPHEEIQPTIRGKLTSNKRGFTVHETGWWVQFRLYIFNCSTIPNPFFLLNGTSKSETLPVQHQKCHGFLPFFPIPIRWSIVFSPRLDALLWRRRTNEHPGPGWRWWS